MILNKETTLFLAMIAALGNDVYTDCLLLNQKVNNLHYETSNSELNMRILKLCKYISHYYFYKLLSKICPFLIKKISNKISKYKNHLIHHL